MLDISVTIVLKSFERSLYYTHQLFIGYLKTAKFIKIPNTWFTITTGSTGSVYNITILILLYLYVVIS